MAQVDKLIDAKLDQRLGEFEGRLLPEVRPDDRQPPSEEVKPDYQAMRDSEASKERSADRILKSLTTGRAKVATTSPQYKAAARALDKFIEELQKSAPVSTPESTQ